MRITGIESTGLSTFVRGDSEGIQITALFNDRPSLAKGDIIHLVSRPDRQHLFDATTGDRIGSGTRGRS
jgi:multiple sugar transport system ATP-binding protein